MDWRCLETSSLQAPSETNGPNVASPFRTVLAFFGLYCLARRVVTSRVLASAYEKQLAALDGVKLGRKRRGRRKRRENNHATFWLAEVGGSLQIAV